MDLNTLFKELRSRRIFLKAAGEDIQYFSYVGPLPGMLRDAIAADKENILIALREAVEYRAAVNEPIPVLPAQGYYELSHGQKRFVILDELEAGVTTHNMFTSHSLTGKLDLQLLQKVFDLVIERHEILRTNFLKIDNAYRQVIKPGDAMGFKLLLLNWRGKENLEKNCGELEKEELIRNFNLAEGPLFRATLVQTGTDSYIFYLTLHHIISDGWSQEVLLKDVIYIYNALITGKDPDMSPLPIQYKEYAAWLNKKLESKEGVENEQYWLSQFRTEPALIDLPSDFSRPASKNHLGMSLSFDIETGQVHRLRQLGIRHGITMYTFFFAVLKSLLYRYTGTEDITVGTPLASRDHPQLANQIGFYVNTLAFRTQVNPKQTFRSLLMAIAERSNQHFRHQMYPFDLLVDKLGFRRNLARHPLFDIFFTYENARDRKREMKLSDISIKAMPVGHCMDKFDIEFTVIEDAEDRIECYINYSTALFKKQRIERFAENIITIFNQALANLDIRICDFELPGEVASHLSTNGLSELSGELFDFGA